MSVAYSNILAAIKDSSHRDATEASHGYSFCPKQVVSLEELFLSQAVLEEGPAKLPFGKGISMKEEFLERVRIAGEEKKAKKGII